MEAVLDDLLRPIWQLMWSRGEPATEYLVRLEQGDPHAAFSEHRGRNAAGDTATNDDRRDLAADAKRAMPFGGDDDMRTS